MSASPVDGSLESAVALQYANESEVDSRADIEAAIGSTASERSVSIDGRMVVVDGTFEEMFASNE